MHTSRRLAGHDMHEKLTLTNSISWAFWVGIDVAVIVLAILTTCCDTCVLCCAPVFVDVLSCTLKTHQNIFRLRMSSCDDTNRRTLERKSCSMCKGREWSSVILNDLNFGNLNFNLFWFLLFEHLPCMWDVHPSRNGFVFALLCQLEPSYKKIVR